MLRVARLSYKCHYLDLTPAQRARLTDLAEDMKVEAEQMKKDQARRKREMDVERESRAD